MNQALPKPRSVRAAFSLVEMIAATALVAGTLVPALVVMRQSMALSREASQRNLLSNYAVMKLEEHAGIAMRNWANGTSNGDFAAYGHSELGYQVVQSDDPSDAGLDDQLMSIKVNVFEDLNSDQLPTAGELQVEFRTKVSKLLSYENEDN